MFHVFADDCPFSIMVDFKETTRFLCFDFITRQMGLLLWKMIMMMMMIFSD